MNIIIYAVQQFAGIATVLLYIFFLYRMLDTKINVSNQLLAGAIYSCASIAYYYTDFGYRPLFSLIAGMIYAHFVFFGKFRTHLLWVVIAIVLDGITDSSVISMYLLLPNASMATINSPGLIRAGFIIISKASLFLIYFAITLKIDKSDLLDWRESIFLLSVPMGCWEILELTFSLEDLIPNKISNLYMTAGSLTLLAIVVGLFISYNHAIISLKELAQSKVKLRSSEMTKEHIDQINKLYSQLSAIRHDLHNHFYAMSGCIKAGDYKRLEEYINTLIKMEGNVMEYVKHPVLNALISTRLEMAKNKGIEFSSNIALPEKLPINDVDLCILISNILDNAFDAAIESFEPHMIELNMQVIDSYWVVACRNSTKEHGKLRASGNLKSTKQSIGVHGIGTKEINEIAEKTGGFVTYKHENYEFSTLVMLDLPDNPGHNA